MPLPADAIPLSGPGLPADAIPLSPETPKAPPAEQSWTRTLVQPAVNVGRGLLDIARASLALPGELKERFGQAAEIDWSEALTSPGQVAEAAAETGKEFYRTGIQPLVEEAPTLVGMGLGAAAGSPTAGAMTGRYLQDLTRTYLGGEDVTPKQMYEDVGTTGLGTALAANAPDILSRVARPLRGAAGPELPGVRAQFERVGVEPTLADVTGRTLPGTAENMLSRSIGGSRRIQAAQEAQREGLRGGYERAIESLGPTEGRALTGQQAVETFGKKIDALRSEAGRLHQQVSRLAPDSPPLSTENLRAEAAAIAQEIRQAHPAIAGEFQQPLAMLDKLASPGIQAVEEATGLLDLTGRPLTKVVQKGRDLRQQAFDEWDRTQRILGQMSRDPNMVRTISGGQASRLYGAAQRDMEVWTQTAGSTAPEAQAALTHFREFYKNNVVPFNESLPGKLASGRLNPEDVTRLFSRDGLTELQQVKRYGDPELFAGARNAWLGNMLRTARVIDGENFNVGAFRRVWNSIDPEVKTRAFTREQITALNDVSEVGQRLNLKFTVRGGANPSGSGLTMVPLSELLWMLGSAGGVIRQAVQGDLLGMAGATASLALPAGAANIGARMVTRPGSIRKLTTPRRPVPPSVPLGAAGVTGLDLTRPLQEERKRKQ